jgi:hypothetical protein
MMTNRLEQQLPIDTVEVTFDVDVEHPVVAPAALTSLAYGLDRRSAGPVAIRVGVEHRLQIRLQVASGDLLGDTVGDVGMPNGRVPPSAFGISTRRTGGGK